MNADDQNRLEAEVDQQLKELPNRRAPRTLAPRVMARIRGEVTVPWYQQAWQFWPGPARIASLVVMLAVFGGICFGGWRLMQMPGASLALNQATGWFSGVEVAWNAGGALVSAVGLAFSKLGQGLLIAGLVIAVFNYLACVGLGTLVVRFAFSNSRRNSI